MKASEEIKSKKIAQIQIDPSLDKYDHVILFPEKLKAANESVKEAGVPNLPNKKKPNQYF